jgi:hypothetical protein
MIVDGSIVTNAVFDRTCSAMLNPAATLVEQWEMLAKYVPAVSSAAGKVAAFKDSDKYRNLDEGQYKNGWGREPSEGDTIPWLHSDIKDMSYRYIYSLFNEFVDKGGMK